MPHNPPPLPQRNKVDWYHTITRHSNHRNVTVKHSPGLNRYGDLLPRTTYCVVLNYPFLITHHNEKNTFLSNIDKNSISWLSLWKLLSLCLIVFVGVYVYVCVPRSELRSVFNKLFAINCYFLLVHCNYIFLGFLYNKECVHENNYSNWMCFSNRLTLLHSFMRLSIFKWGSLVYFTIIFYQNGYQIRGQNFILLC